MLLIAGTNCISVNGDFDTTPCPQDRPIVFCCWFIQLMLMGLVALVVAVQLVCKLHLGSFGQHVLLRVIATQVHLMHMQPERKWLLTLCWGFILNAPCCQLPIVKCRAHAWAPAQTNSKSIGRAYNNNNNNNNLQAFQLVVLARYLLGVTKP